MEKSELGQFKAYIRSLLNYMERNGYTKKPFPKVVVNTEKGENGIFDYTAYYDPDKREVMVFTSHRGMKDCLRSIAHEMVHHKQNIEGRLGKDAYSGDKITEDERLVKLEEEAYRDGNVSFRSWTETERNKR